MPADTRLPSKFRCRGCSCLTGESNNNGDWRVICSGAGAEIEPPRKRDVPRYELCPHRPDYQALFAVNATSVGVSYQVGFVQIAQIPLPPERLIELSGFARLRRGELLQMRDRGELNQDVVVEEILGKEIALFEATLKRDNKLNQ